jgi:hypothetical protein
LRIAGLRPALNSMCGNDTCLEPGSVSRPAMWS